jgi:hypothetical protein
MLTECQGNEEEYSKPAVASGERILLWSRITVYGFDISAAAKND